MLAEPEPPATAVPGTTLMPVWANATGTISTHQYRHEIIRQHSLLFKMWVALKWGERVNVNQFTPCGAALSTVLRIISKVSDKCNNISHNYAKFANGWRPNYTGRTETHMENPTLDREVVVLLAEHDPDIRVMLEKLLKQGGYDLLVVEDGQQALQKSEEHKGRIDILVADIQMPGMTGADLAREMRRTRQDLRIMLLSPTLQGLLVLDSTWHFLQKPFLPKALLERIVDVIKKPPAANADRGA